MAASDLGTTFFVNRDQLGSPRAQCCTQLLNELNEDVRGEFLVKVGWCSSIVCWYRPYPTISQAPAQWIEEDAASALQDISLVIVACNGISESQIGNLSSLCFEKTIPMMLVRMNGFVGYMRIQTNQHTGEQ